VSTLVSAWPLSLIALSGAVCHLSLLYFYAAAPPGVTTFSLVCFSLSGVLLLTPSLSSSTVSWFPFLSLSFPERLRLVLFSLWPFRTASAPSFGILLSVPVDNYNQQYLWSTTVLDELYVLSPTATLQLVDSLWKPQNCCPVAPYRSNFLVHSTTTLPGLYGLLSHELTPPFHVQN
jgi:hypothetical protein